MKHLLIVEDDRLLLERLVADARASSPSWTVSAAGTLAEARALVADRPPDAAFVDLGLPDGDGIELVAELRRARPDCDVLVITVFADPQRVISSLEAGASGYVLKTDLPQYAGQLVSTIESGGSSVSPAIARQLIARLRPERGRPQHDVPAEPLSSREVEILNLCARGLRFAEVAGVLGVSVHTVHTHLKNVYRKLRVNSRSEAVYEARRAGLIRD